MSTVTQGDWQRWSAQTWGSRLFDYFFVSAGGDARPVSRLALSPDDLSRASGLSGVDSQNVRDAFIGAIRCSEDEFRRHMSQALLRRGDWLGDRLPPFFIYLLFTCFAAASIDETLAVGVFRERLRLLLGHPVGTSYALNDLPVLWKALERWLELRRQEGAPYRALILPDPGWMKLIGYSRRLAFPSQSDARKLALLARRTGWTDSPTIPEALEVLNREIDQFSVGFREVFAVARRAFTEATDAPELESIWSAVVEAANLVTVLRADEHSRVRYQLFLQEDDLLLADLYLLASGVDPARQGREKFSQLEDPISDYAFQVCTNSDGSTALSAKQLSHTALLDVVPGLHGTPVLRAVKEGVLLFCRTDAAVWELAVSRPDEGTVRALVAERLRRPFLDLFVADSPSDRRSKFDGWVQVEPFDVSSVSAVIPEISPALAAVRCLQATRIGTGITLSEGVRVDNGYLGLWGVLPVARCSGAQSMELFEVRSTPETLQTSLCTSLTRGLQGPETFEFEEGTSDLDGEFNLVATRSQKTIASRDVTFYPRVRGHHYRLPGDTDQWMIEAGGPAVLPASEGADCFLNSAPEMRNQRAAIRVRILRSDADCPPDAPVEPFSVDDDQKLDRFAEALAAISTNRKGLGEGELLDLLIRIVGIDRSQVWDVVRAWVEAGYLDVLLRRRWRGRAYFARQPRLVVTRLDPHPVVVLHGLAPYQLRARARTVLQDVGATAIASCSVTRVVGAPQSWGVESVAEAATAADLLHLGPIEFAHSASACSVPLAKVVSLSVDPLPGYECQGLWDWESGGFRREHRDGVPSTVLIEWHTRADRPDLFLVGREGRESWSTNSRNWALLIGHLWAGKPTFEAHGVSTLVRSRGVGPYVPLPLARAMALRSGVTSGPMEAVDGYAYVCDGARERDWFLCWLQGRVNRGDTPRLRWLLSAIAESLPSNDDVPFPVDVARRLRELDIAGGEALWLSGRRIPRHMLPHLRRAVEEAGV